MPEEIPHFAAAIYARDGDGSANLFELKHLAECLMPGCEARAGVCAALRASGACRGSDLARRNVGRLFELHPSLGVEGRAAISGFGSGLRLQGWMHDEVRYQPLRRFPTSAFDLSVVAPLRDPSGKIEQHLATAAGRGSGGNRIRPSNTPALRFRKTARAFRTGMTVGAPDRTLSSDEVATIRSRVIEAMRAAGYELRV